MDKKTIKTFAIKSRKKLIEEIKYQANLLGIKAEFIAEPVEKAEGMEVYNIGASTPNTIYDEAIKQRKNLVKRIKEKGFDYVIEEVAYTWFNRIIAIRFMEVNDYLPTRIRVLSSETEQKTEPDIVTESPNIDLNLSNEDIERINQFKNDNELDKLFKFLFIKQCNKLNEILPELFEKTADYTELLLSISFTNEDGVVRQLIDNISEEDFTDQVEIIGWIYQYYNTELKDETFKQLKNRVKISKERIPAATQLFTPDWIVRYMVENSLGRLWLEGHPNTNLKENWKYYLDEAEQEPEVQIELVKIREDSKNLKPEDIKVIDPAMGSGHILVYAFEVLMQIYTAVGYSERDAAVSIIENNLYGLDIDDRAYQLAYFSLMMKARSYNRKILTKNINPQICSIQESNNITDDLIKFITAGDIEVYDNLNYLKDVFIDAKEFGSILDVNKIDFEPIFNYLDQIKSKDYSDITSINYQYDTTNDVKPILQQSFILSRKYDVVVTNPPYMGNNSMNKKLLNYLKKNYPDSKRDIFAVFIEKCFKMTKEYRYLAMITQQAFMFLSSYEKLRDKILEKVFINMIHLGPRAFEEIGGEVVQTTTFVMQNCYINSYESKYFDLVLYNSQITKENAFLNKKNSYIAAQENFVKIPGSPFAYWLTETMIQIFEELKPLSEYAEIRQGLATTDNKRFLRFWHEVDFENIDFKSVNTTDAKYKGFKWFPYNKGGLYRKWYGNQDYIVNYHNDGEEIKNNVLRKYPYLKTPDFVVKNTKFYFKPALTWSKVTSNFGVRYTPKGFIFAEAGSSVFLPESDILYVAGFLCTELASFLINILNPTMNFQVSDVASLPIKYTNETNKIEVENMVKVCIEISKDDWNSFETSWSFSKHPLMTFEESLIEDSFNKWYELTMKRYSKLKSTEEKLNDIFIKIYNIESELDSIKDPEITINKANLSRDIKSFLSYALGCILGRYSLDKEGLIFAGGQWDPSKYSKFIPDEDNIIPILDTEYFEDDIVGRFVEFVKVTFGDETLEENLDFIAKALKKKGSTSREVIRNYFLTDFYKDHVKTYKKHPIYWQFDSGKNNGFKALIYMHRYEPDLVARVRTDYLHKTQKALEMAIAHNDGIIESSSSTSENAKAIKTNNKLITQLEETRKYDEALAHIANQKIQIDLDDGVKVNYAKFQGIEISSEGKKATKINLLTRI